MQLADMRQIVFLHKLEGLKQCAGGDDRGVQTGKTQLGKGKPKMILQKIPASFQIEIFGFSFVNATGKPMKERFLQNGIAANKK